MSDIYTSRIPFRTKAVHLISGDGVAIDISAITAGFALYESINSKFVTADITIVDGLNLIKNYRFTGQEHIRIELSNDDSSDISKDTEEDSGEETLNVLFRVYKLSNVERPKSVFQTYQINLCDPYMFNANTTRLSKVYRGSYLKMLKDTFDDMGHTGALGGVIPAQLEETKTDKAQFIVPNWRASTFIDWIVEHADNTTGSWKNSMFFYQTFRHGFKFQSFSNMCGTSTEQEVSEIKTLHYTAGAGEVDSYEGELVKKEQVLNISKPQLFDTLRGTAKGAYASISLSYDPISKIEFKNRYNILETFKETGSHVSGPNPIIRTAEDPKEVFLPFTSGDSEFKEGVVNTKDLPHYSQQFPNHQENSFVLYNYNTNHDFDNNNFTQVEAWEGSKGSDNSKLERNALLEILKQHRIIIIIPVRTDISAGDIIELDQAEPEISSNPKDTINDNKYLVVDSCLTVNLQVPGGYGSLQLECVKESFAQEVTKERVADFTEVSDAREEVK
jgi:hypothetical protein